MEFCDVCENLLYLESNGDTLVHLCKKCGNTVDAKGSIVSSTVFTKRKQTAYINKYTKMDATLPRIYTMACPNQECENHVPEDEIAVKRPEIISIRYDNQDLKYMYLCPKCNATWKHE